MNEEVNPEIETCVVEIIPLVERIGLEQAQRLVAKRLIEKTMEATGQNGTQAALLLKMNRTTLVMQRRKLRLPMNPSHRR